MLVRIKKSFIIICASLWICAGVANAENFPPETDAIVQDADQVMDPSQVEQLSGIIEKLPEKYKVVIVPSTEDMTTEQYAHELFSRRALSPDHILLVFNAERGELGAKAGSGFERKGLTEENVRRAIEHHFAPHSRQSSFMTGIAATAEGLSDIIQNGPPANRVESASNVREGQDKGASGWLYYAVGVLAVVIGGGTYAGAQRKKWTREMDDIEDWLDKIEENLKRLDEDPQVRAKKDHPVISLVEKVRKQSLPQAEYSLLEADGALEKFRFKKTENLVRETKNLLANIDHEISQAQSKLFQAKITEEEYERLIEEIQETKTVLERKLDETRIQYNVPFDELREFIKQTNEWLGEISEEGTDEAAALIEPLRERKQLLIDQLKEIERFPELRQEVAVALERDLLQLQDDFQEMLDQGYQIPADFYEEAIENMKEDILNLQQLVQTGRIQGVSRQVEELHEEIDSFYDLMEEVVAKKAKANHYLKEIPQTIHSLETEEKQLADELEELSVRYRVQEGAIFNYYLELRKVCEEARDQLFLAKQMDAGNDLEFIRAADHLESLQQKIESLLSLREEAYEELEELRKGEFEAKEMIVQLYAELDRLEQQARRRNLPGIPDTLSERMALGRGTLADIEAVLEEVPLDLQKINALAKNAKEEIEKVVADTHRMFEMCAAIEEKIQLTNRFRSRSPEINELLVEAEEAFLSADYERADERASEAYELATGFSKAKASVGFKFKR